MTARATRRTATDNVPVGAAMHAAFDLVDLRHFVHIRRGQYGPHRADAGKPFSHGSMGLAARHVRRPVYYTMAAPP